MFPLGIFIGGTPVHDLFPEKIRNRAIYSTISMYVGFDECQENYRRGFGSQVVDGMPADLLFVTGNPTIGTRSNIGGCGLWHFTDSDKYAHVAAHMAESADAYRRYEIWEDAHAHTGNPLYENLSNRSMNRMEMAYGSAMELRYNVQ